MTGPDTAGAGAERGSSVEWSVQQIARAAGTTSRTLRHYDSIGLLKPSRTGGNGYRYYDQACLVRLQRILLLRDLGLGLPAIAGVLDHEPDAARALDRHLEWLRQEERRLARQIASLRQTLEALTTGGDIMADNMFDGFDHTRYRDEVEERWGRDAYAGSDAWWRGMDAAGRESWKERSRQLGSDWIAAAGSGVAADSGRAQELARRHVEWLTAIPGTPGSAAGTGGDGGTADLLAYITGLGEMYVADPRFAANYGGAAGAGFVRDALRVYADRNL